MIHRPVVLLLEEDFSLANALEAILVRQGMQVHWQDNAEHFFEHFEKNPSLLIFRHNPQLIDSLGLIRASRDLTPNLPVICLKNYNQEEMEGEDLSYMKEANVVLALPLDLGDLLDAAHALLHHRRPPALKVSWEHPMRGRLSEISFENLLLSAFNKRLTGKLTIHYQQVRKVFLFLHGFPCGASSNVHTEALGNMLVQRNLCDEETLREALGVLHEKKITLGQALIQKRVIKRDRLYEVLDAQVRERFWSCFELKNGTYEFFESDTLQGFREPFVQNPIALLQVGITRFRNASLLEKSSEKDSQQHVIPTHYFKSRVSYLNLGKTRRELLSLIDGQRTFRELQEFWRGSKEAFFLFFSVLISAEMVLLSPTPIPTRGLDELREQLVPKKHLRRLMLFHTSLPEISVSSGGEFSGMGSGLFRASRLQELPVLTQLIKLSSKQLEELNYFEMFGLNLESNPYDIHTQVRNTLRYVEHFSKNSDTGKLSWSKLKGCLSTAAKTLLSVDHREAYRRKIVPHLGRHLESAQEYLKAGRFDLASALLEEMDSAHPTNAQVTTLLAKSLYSLHKPAKPIQIARIQALLHRAIALDEQNAEAYYILGCVEQDLGNVSQARNAWLHAITIDPSHTRSIGALYP